MTLIKVFDISSKSRFEIFFINIQTISVDIGEFEHSFIKVLTI